MARRPLVNKELRCFCSRKPLLATYGLDESRKLFIHIKIYKQHRIFGEIVVTEGDVRIACRDCFRWHRVKIVQPERAELVETSRPDVVAERPSADACPNPT